MRSIGPRPQVGPGEGRAGGLNWADGRCEYGRGNSHRKECTRRANHRGVARVQVVGAYRVTKLGWVEKELLGEERCRLWKNIAIGA
jgi:hypothetical protein